MKPFSITYTWADAQGEYEGHTVVIGPDAATALDKFLRRNRHLKSARLTNPVPPVNPVQNPVANEVGS